MRIYTDFLDNPVKLHRWFLNNSSVVVFLFDVKAQESVRPGFQGLLGEFVLSGTCGTQPVINGAFHSGTRYPINLTL